LGTRVGFGGREGFLKRPFFDRPVGCIDSASFLSGDIFVMQNTTLASPLRLPLPLPYTTQPLLFI
jgi:hypothetical protein